MYQYICEQVSVCAQNFFHVIVLSCILALSPAVLFPVRPLEVCARENDENSTTSELYALSAVLMDADNGRILLQKNASEVLPMASTTKDHDLYPGA